MTLWSDDAGGAQAPNTQIVNLLNREDDNLTEARALL